MAFRTLLLLLVAFPAWAASAGVNFDDKARVADTELSLTGAGLRKRFVFHMLRDVGAEPFIDALVDGIKANHSEAEAKALDPRMRQLGATIVRALLRIWLGDKPVQDDLKKSLLGA